MSEESRVSNSGMVHLNGGVLCAIDVETTGANPRKHDIIQVAVLPLDNWLKPRKEIVPFYLNLIPNKDMADIDFEACAVSQINLAKLSLEGVDQYRAAELFEDWVNRLKLPPGKRIFPLAQNWLFDRSFLIEWLGAKMFENLIDGRYRDTMAVANFCNDKADFQGEAFPYQKVNLTYLCNTLHVDRIGKAHDALSDCYATAEVYRRMLKGLL